MATSTVLIGMTIPQLQAALVSAQQAYIDLMSGNRGVSFSYTQGDGSKSVSYEKLDLYALQQFISQLQVALGLVSTNSIRRRPIRPIF